MVIIYDILFIHKIFPLFLSSASDAMKLKAKSCREEHEAECSQINVVLQHNIDEVCTIFLYYMLIMLCISDKM